MLFGSRVFGERPRQHELGLEYGVEIVDEPVQGRRQVPMDRVPNPALNVRYRPPSIALVPSPVQRLGCDAQLDDKVVAQILRLGFPALFLPEPDQRRFVRAQNDPRVRAAEELPSVWFSRSASCDRSRWFEAHLDPL